MTFRVHRGGIVAGYKAADAFTTTENSFATVESFDVTMLSTKRVRFSAAGNNLAVRILGSYDGGATYPETVHGSATVNSGASTVVTVSSYYTHLRVQAVPAVDNNHGTATVVLAGASF